MEEHFPVTPARVIGLWLVLGCIWWLMNNVFRPLAASFKSTWRHRCSTGSATLPIAPAGAFRTPRGCSSSFGPHSAATGSAGIAPVSPEA